MQREEVDELSSVNQLESSENSSSQQRELPHQTSKVGEYAEMNLSNLAPNSSSSLLILGNHTQNKTNNFTFLTEAENGSSGKNLNKTSKSAARQYDSKTLLRSDAASPSARAASVKPERKTLLSGPSSKSPMPIISASPRVQIVPDVTSIVDRTSLPNLASKGAGFFNNPIRGDGKRKFRAAKNSISQTLKISFIIEKPKEDTFATFHKANVDTVKGDAVEPESKEKRAEVKKEPERPPCSRLTITNAAKATDCRVKLEKCHKQVDTDKIKVSRLFLDYCLEANNANCKVQIDLSEYRDSFSGSLTATSNGADP